MVERFTKGGFNPIDVPGVLVASHAPFAWGKTEEKAVENAIVLEFAAQMALHTLALAPNTPSIPKVLLDKHFLRKHGAKAYYGQEK
jgi:L-ribulose-5-phosphate 4-epimerase